MVESFELTPRQQSILRLIVRLHVDTAGTVASRTLVDQYDLNISPATVRNEMAELGFLQQPHTSAGRVPTEMGFRYYVQRLMKERALPQSEQRKIAHQFHQARDHIDTWLPLATSVLSKSARGAAILTAPRSTHATFKHLEMISTHGHAVLLILVLEGGSVEQQLLSLSEYMPQNALREAADRLNQVCAGLNTGQIEARMHEFPPLETDIANLVVSIMHNVEDEPSDELYYHGLYDLLRSPEFSEPDSSSVNLVRSLEERSLLHAVLSETLTPSVGVGTVCVLIGGEGRWDELRSCSVVLARYGVANYVTGTMGVVGPVRMHYGRAISAVRFVASMLGEMVYDFYQPAISTSSINERLT